MFLALKNSSETKILYTKQENGHHVTKIMETWCLYMEDKWAEFAVFVLG